MGDVLSRVVAIPEIMLQTFHTLTDEKIRHLLSNESDLNDYMATYPTNACITTLLSQASRQNNRRTMKIILEFIVRQLEKRLQSRTVRVWAGEAITGKDDRETVLVCFYVGNCNISMKYFFGLRIIYREYDTIDNESKTARSLEVDQNRDMTKQMHDLLHTAIKSNGRRLFAEHTNLEAISSGSIISSRSRGLVQDGCIIVYCRLKGVIPFGEKSFPKQLYVNNKGSVAVDVREGFFSHHSDVVCQQNVIIDDSQQIMNLTELNNLLLTMNEIEPDHSPLTMGCSVGRFGCNIIGTIGPFVRINENRTGFLTCAHVLFGNNLDKLRDLKTEIRKGVMRTEVVQPAIIGEICGRVLTAVFNGNWPDSTHERFDHIPSDAFGIDTAVIEITSRVPIAGEFVLIDKSQLDSAGFTHNQPPRFNTGKIKKFPITDELERPVIKVGSETGLTTGRLKLTNGMVRYSSIKGNLGSINNTMEQTEIWHGLMAIDPIRCMKFCAAGDSGAGIFLVGDDNTLTCIGLIIGDLSDGTGIATPIDKVLTALNDDRSLRIELQVF